jgi:hypothetical protein
MEIVPVDETLRRVLPLFDGVRIGRIRAHSSGNVSVFIQVTEPRSLVRLASCAENANVAFYVWSDSQIRVEPNAIECEGPWFELRAQGDPPESQDMVPTAQMLCEFMIHDLCKRGILEKAEGDLMLARFGWGE